MFAFVSEAITENEEDIISTNSSINSYISYVEEDYVDDDNYIAVSDDVAFDNIIVDGVLDDVESNTKIEHITWDDQ